MPAAKKTAKRTTQSTRQRTTNRSTEERVASAASIDSVAIRPSRDRVDHLSSELADALSRSRSVVFLKERAAVVQALAQAITEEFRHQEQREENALKRIGAMNDAPPRDSKEWRELFRRLVEEEFLREGLDS